MSSLVAGRNIPGPLEKKREKKKKKTPGAHQESLVKIKLKMSGLTSESVHTGLPLHSHLIDYKLFTVQKSDH